MLWFSPPWDSVVYWSVDLETGGLDPRHDAVLAIGMVPIRGGVIRVGESWQTLVKPDPGSTFNHSSIVAHQLVPSEVANAPSLAEALTAFEVRLRGAVLLVHQSAIDVAFLKRAFAEAGRPWPKPPVVDTVDLLMKAAQRAMLVDPSATGGDPELNLTKARRELGLPDYGGHDALTDAISTAELFLVLRKRLGAKRLGSLT
jgi:DNA polymerase III subunit epsilon